MLLSPLLCKMGEPASIPMMGFPNNHVGGAELLRDLDKNYKRRRFMYLVGKRFRGASRACSHSVSLLLNCVAYHICHTVVH